MNFNTEIILGSKSKIIDIDKWDKSYSPYFSNIGFTASKESCGIEALVLHYNRASRDVWAPFVNFGQEVVRVPSSIERLVFQKAKKAEAVFYGCDMFILETEGLEQFTICDKTADNTVDLWVESQFENYVIFRGNSLNKDGRDPDEMVPFLAGIKAVRGKIENKDGQVLVCPDDMGKSVVAFVIEILEMSVLSVLDKLNSAPESAENAAKMSKDWFEKCLNGFEAIVETEREKDMLEDAIRGVLFNATMAPGYLKDYISSYPNRGTYPCHFLWDTCFQNLALEYLNPSLVKDSLLLIARCQRFDGKYEQFLCSTWARPRETQPALVGWAVKRFINSCNNWDADFIRVMFNSLKKNNEWWLSQRMTKFGVIYCPHGLETGQDDSPRFDRGPILAVDMNSYLLNQMRVTAELAELLEMREESVRWKHHADVLEENMLHIFYDERKNMFFDGDIKSGERKELWSASGFLPLWAGVDIGSEMITDMIKSHMLNEKRFWGKIPFPCIAYNEDVYEPDKWWRGPVWMSLAWLMVEILEKYGFIDEFKHVCNVYYEMILKDGHLRELFHSQTGEGIGAYSQGWTAAVFVKLNQILYGESYRR